MTTYRIGIWFQRIAVLCAPLGMIFGAYIGASRQLELAPVHAHLLLIGWVSFFIVGQFYRGIDARFARLGAIHLMLAAGGLAVLVPALYAFLLGNVAAERGLEIGGTAIILGFVIFAWVVFAETRARRPE
jgi:hypothetical protein